MLLSVLLKASVMLVLVSLFFLVLGNIILPNFQFIKKGSKVLAYFLDIFNSFEIITYSLEPFALFPFSLKLATIFAFSLFGSIARIFDA